MLAKIYQILENLENKIFDFKLFVAAFLSIVILRSFLENFAVLSIGGYNFFFQWTAGLVHFPLWFLNVFIWTAIIAHLFTKEKIIKISGLLMYSFPIILLPTLLDLVITLGNGRELSYLFPQSLKELFSQTLYFFFNENISKGLRIEIFLSSLAAIFYVYRKTKNALKAVGASLTFYITLIAIHGSLPGLIFILGKILGENDNSSDIRNFYNEILLSNDNIAIGRGYFSSFQPPWEAIYGIFNLTTALFIFITLIVGLIIFFYIWNKEKFVVFFGNLRPERLAHYWLLAVLGIGISYITFRQLPPFSIFNISSIIILFLVIALFRCFAINLNDINDIKCDRISNPNRPLIRGGLDIIDMKNINIILFFLSIWGGVNSWIQGFAFFTERPCRFFYLFFPAITAKKYSNN